MDLTAIRTGLELARVDARLDDWRETRHAGVAWKPLHVEGDAGARDPAAATVLIRMAPGASYPEHEHLGIEEVLILAGGYRDGLGEHRAGSYLRYAAGSRHAPVALGDPDAPVGEQNPACILFAVAHGGVRNTVASVPDRGTEPRDPSTGTR